jgi:glycosyltransferase involved in cell wall biosynthesis
MYPSSSFGYAGGFLQQPATSSPRTKTAPGSAGDSDRPLLSIVVPVHNESESLGELVSAIRQALGPFQARHELLFVDDGSTDDTLEKLRALAGLYPEVRIFSFRRNLGKSPALECGFQMARGEYILTLDADLQDEPDELPRMYDTLSARQLDIVSGWREHRRDRRLKVLSSRVFNLVVVRMLFGASFRDMNSGLKLYRASAARELRLYGGMHRFIPLIASEMGFRVAELPVRHHERKYGSSKYRSTKILTELPDLLTLFFLVKYNRRPLHFFGKIGSALLVAGFAVLTYLTVLWLQGHPIGTRPLLTFGVLLVLVGGQIVFTGLLADLIVNMNQNGRQPFPFKYVSDPPDPTAKPEPRHGS